MTLRQWRLGGSYLNGGKKAENENFIRLGGKKQQDDHAVALATLSFHQKLKMKNDGSVIL